MSSGNGKYCSFDPVAADYDRTRLIPPGVLSDIARVCVHESKLSEGGSFLDAGVGTGRIFAPMSSLYPRQIFGLDISAAMMQHARDKTPSTPLHLAQGDLQYLPFRTGAFAGALAVHVLHLVEHWRVVLMELRRVLAPHSGVLLIGAELGAHSALVDFYYERARARGVLGHSLGTAGLTQALGFLRRDPAAHVQQLALPHLRWKRSATVAETLQALAQRTYSLMWNIRDEDHQELMQESVDFAERTLGGPSGTEVLASQFTLHTVRWMSAA